MTQPLLGADPTENSATNSYGLALGQIFDGANNKRYIRVQAAAAITAGAYVSIDENYSATMITKALADTGNKVGCCPTALTSAYYGWAQIYGPVSGLVLANMAADIALYTTASAGYLASTTTNQTKINGVTIASTAAGSTAAGVAACMMEVEPFPSIAN
jgi:hypothetical protein